MNDQEHLNPAEDQLLVSHQEMYRSFRKSLGAMIAVPTFMFITGTRSMDDFWDRIVPFMGVMGMWIGFAIHYLHVALLHKKRKVGTTNR
jgi:hypothetical protein